MAELNIDRVTFDAKKMSAQDIWDFEEKTKGMDLIEFSERLQRGEVNAQNFTKYLRPIVAILWISLRQEQPKLTFEEVASHPMLRIIEAVDVASEKKPLEPLEQPKPATRQRRTTRPAPASA